LSTSAWSRSATSSGASVSSLQTVSAVANDDTETALLIAGGSSWMHWLAGTAGEGARWLAAGFACAEAASEQTRALALAGRGLIESIAGSFEAADQDLREALEIFHSNEDGAGVMFSLTFFTEVARLSGRLEEARARRLRALDVYRALPDGEYVVAVREHSLAVLAMIDNDLDEAEPHYRAAANGFRSTDRPVMLAITLGVLADLDERHGRYHEAVEELEEAVELAETAGMRGFVGSLYSRLAWSLLEEGDIARAELMIERALDAGLRLRSPHILFLAHAGSALLHRVRGRNDEAAVAAREALSIHELEGPSRFRNRIDPDFEIASVLAVCCTILAVVAVELDEPGTAIGFLERADRLRTEVGAPEPKFQVDDLARARQALATA